MLFCFHFQHSSPQTNFKSELRAARPSHEAVVFFFSSTWHILEVCYGSSSCCIGWTPDPPVCPPLLHTFVIALSHSTSCTLSPWQHIRGWNDSLFQLCLHTHGFLTKLSTNVWAPVEMTWTLKASFTSMNQSITFICSTDHHEAGHTCILYLIKENTWYKIDIKKKKE